MLFDQALCRSGGETLRYQFTLPSLVEEHRFSHLLMFYSFNYRLESNLGTEQSAVVAALLKKLEFLREELDQISQ